MNIFDGPFKVDMIQVDPVEFGLNPNLGVQIQPPFIDEVDPNLGIQIQPPFIDEIDLVGGFSAIIKATAGIQQICDQVIKYFL